VTRRDLWTFSALVTVTVGGEGASLVSMADERHDEKLSTLGIRYPMG
jgi:hypothetical protein